MWLDLLTVKTLPCFIVLVAGTALKTGRSHSSNVVKTSDAQILKVRHRLHSEVGNVVTLLCDDHIINATGPSLCNLAARITSRRHRLGYIYKRNSDVTPYTRPGSVTCKFNKKIIINHQIIDSKYVERRQDFFTMHIFNVSFDVLEAMTVNIFITVRVTVYLMVSLSTCHSGLCLG